MKTTIVGATGFVGRALVLLLQGRGHAVTVLARDPKRAANGVPAGVGVAAFTDDAALDAAVADADAVVDLAGEAIAGHRWTKRRKARLVASRVDVARRLAASLAKRSKPLPVLVSASASGWYGDRGAHPLDESAPPGTGFAAELCRDWEAAAAATPADRVVRTRFGVILGREGGALAVLRPIYKLGLGGPIGSGDAWFPWVHLDDAVRAIAHCIDCATLSGPVNVVGPVGARQRELAHAYARTLHRPSALRTPKLALRIALGEASQILTASQHVVPRALLASGFEFQFSTVEAALADLADDGVSIERAHELPADSLYLHARGARYVLRATTELAAPRDEVFEFFSSPENLAALTPPSLGFEMLERDGERIDYKITVAGVPLKWRTWIEQWSPGEGFVDSQVKGPYRSWWHEHRFFSRGDTTVMTDTVYFSPPLAGLGRLVVEDMLRRIFGFRRDAIRTRFNARHLALAAAVSSSAEIASTS